MLDQDVICYWTIKSLLSQFVFNSIQMIGAKLKVTCKEVDIIILHAECPSRGGTDKIIEYPGSQRGIVQGARGIAGSNPHSKIFTYLQSQEKTKLH